MTWSLASYTARGTRGFGVLREDGALVHDMLLLQVKTPTESKAPWDYYKVKSVLKGADVFPPINPACQAGK